MKWNNQKDSRQTYNDAYKRGFNAGQDDLDGDFGESFDDSNSFFGRKSHTYRDAYYAGYEDGHESHEDDW